MASASLQAFSLFCGSLGKAREDTIDADALAALLEASLRREDAAGEGGLDLAVLAWLASERPAPGTVYDTALAAFERPLFEAVLRDTGGNQLRAAQVLGINRNALRKRLTELGISPVELAR